MVSSRIRFTNYDLALVTYFRLPSGNSLSLPVLPFTEFLACCQRAEKLGLVTGYSFFWAVLGVFGLLSPLCSRVYILYCCSNVMLISLSPHSLSSCMSLRTDALSPEDVKLAALYNQCDFPGYGIYLLFTSDPLSRMICHFLNGIGRTHLCMNRLHGFKY